MSKTGSSGVSISILKNYAEVSWMVKLFEFFNMVVIFHKMSGWAKIKTSPARPGYYSYEHAHSKHISSTSQEKWSLMPPGHFGMLKPDFHENSYFDEILTSYVTQCNLLFRFKKWSPASGSKTGGSGVSISIWEKYGRVSWMVKSFEYLKTRLDSDKMSADAKIKPSPQAPAYYSYEHTLSC